jgi:hypothetical protein
MRNAFGLRTDFAGKHWPGNYPDTTRNGSEEQGSAIPGLSEETPSSSSETGEITFKQAAVTPDSPEEEACVLLTKMEMSVRGFLAPARREAEAGWSVCTSMTGLCTLANELISRDFKPAFHLARELHRHE